MIGNKINDLPIGLGNIISDYENMDFMMQNRLRLGRNNDGCPGATEEITGNPDRISKENRKIVNSWFNLSLISHVPRVINHPKWLSTGHEIKVCDIALLLKEDGVLSNNYQYILLMKLYPAKMVLFVK